MARLPQPGGDMGDWGDILNEYLRVVHDEEGRIKAGAVGAAQVADGALPQAKIQDLTTDLAAKYTKPTAGVPKSDLDASVQASLDKADTALQSAPPSTGNVSSSGFPLRKPGEKAVSVFQEVAVARAQSSDPVGDKIVVLAESWDKPGVLKHIWIACDNSATINGFLEQGGVVRIYTDNDTTPAVEMSLGDFFFLANRSDVFSTPRVGRTDRGAGGSAYRYLHMPFQKYLRVEVESLMNSDTAFYGTASYSTVNSFDVFGSEQLQYGIEGTRVSNHPARQPLTICDIAGSGQVESLMVSLSGADSGDIGVLEGNVQIYVDGELYPSWSSSGMEDAFNGGWYAMPVGGYPAGRSGNSDQPGANQTMYRFFLDDPIFYSSHIKVVAWAGQQGQGNVVSSTINFAGYVGLWGSSAKAINYRAVDTVAAPVFSNDMSQAAGALDSAVWHEDGSRTPIQAMGSTFVVPYGNGGPDQDVRAAPKNVSLPSEYWVETRVRITDSTHNDQEAGLVMLGASPDPYFGSGVHILLKRVQQHVWTITLRDDFGTPFITYVGGGMELANMWVRFALKRQGNKVTGYYSFNDSPAAWIPVGCWEASKNGSSFGISTWTAGAEFDYLIARPLQSHTS